MSMPRPMYDQHKIAELFGVSRYTVHRWVKGGLCPPPTIRMPQRLLWNPEVIEQWIADGGRPAQHREVNV